MPFITADDLSFSYTGKRDALSHVSFSLEEGEFLTVLGDNGSGKSTLLSLLDALLEPTSGKLTVGGFDVSDRKSRRKIRKMTGLVFQDPDSSFVTEILEDDTAFTPSCYMTDEEKIEEVTSGALSEVGLIGLRKRSVRTLSGGEKQRAAFAGVRTMEPSLYLFDESLSFLDGEYRENLLSVMEGLKKEGRTVVQVTHYADDAVLSDRVMIMKEGRVLSCGKAEEVLYDTDTLKEAGIVPPHTVELILKLRAEGFEIEGSPLTEEDCAGEVMRCMQKLSR